MYKIHILDPSNGISILTYKYTGNVEETELELIDRVKKVLIGSVTLKKWKEMKSRESYQLTIKIFKAYKRAESLREKQKETVLREIKENGLSAEVENGDYTYCH